MAISKQVKVGGSYYKGYAVNVDSTPGAYVLDMALDVSCAINSLSITPDAYGAGDTIKVLHMNSATTASLAVICDTIYNPGANVSVSLDFPALELMAANESLRLVYTNTATVAVAVHTIVEYCGITKTS